MTREKFERLVAEALDGLPLKFREKMANIAVTVESWPSHEDLESVGLDPEEDALYGLYHGVPLPEREFNYGNTLPDRIVLYQDVIEEDAADEDEIREIVQETVVHEVGHYFGLSDEEMEEWEAGGWRE
ncbi:MAG: metallopeptidase family protein [Nitrospirota bacterium]